MKPLKLKFFTDSEWAEVHRYPHQAWQDEVAAGDTRLGYMHWVVAQCESNGTEYILADEADLGDGTPFPAASMEGDDYDDWCYEVENLDTRLGFDQWVFERHASVAFEDEQEMESATAAASNGVGNRLRF